MEYELHIILDEAAVIQLKYTGTLTLSSSAAPTKLARVSNEQMIDFFWRPLSVREVTRLTGMVKATVTRRWKKLGLPTGYYPKDRYRFREEWETREVS